MKHMFKGKRIAGLISCVPKQSFSFDAEFPKYGIDSRRAKRMKDMMGLGEHRIAPISVTSSDLCLFAARRLISKSGLRPDEFNAIVFVTQTPDFFIPPTSSILQARLGLRTDSICFDINQGCAGAMIGLIQAFMLLELDGIQNVLVLAGDTASKQVSPRNRVTWPLIGDAGCAIHVQRSGGMSDNIYSVVNMDGEKHTALMIPAGGYRMPYSSHTEQEHEVEDGVIRSLQQIHMDGTEILNFTMSEVPKQIELCLEFSGNTIDSIDRFCLHQPNAFILRQIAKKLGVDESKLPSDIVGVYGNCSSVSIPLVICHHESCLRGIKKRICMSGFGVGLTWCTMVLDLGPLYACEVVDFDE